MIRLPPPGFVLPVLCAVLTALALMPDAAPPAPLPVSGAVPAAAGPAPRTLPAASDAASVLAAFAARPLLAEGRRPPVVAAPAVPDPIAAPVPEAQPDLSPAPADLDQTPPRLTVVGRLQTAGAAQVLLRDQDSGTEVWAAPGARFGDWTLVEITQMGAILAKAGVQVTIQMFAE